MYVVRYNRRMRPLRREDLTQLTVTSNCKSENLGLLVKLLGCY
jgi:hypothetical protein